MTSVTLITGTRKGIGRHLAEHYLERGHVVVGCSRGAAAIEHELYRHHRLDVADEHAVRQLFHSIQAEQGRLDHLINNAAIGAHNLMLLTPVASVADVMRTNVIGTFLCCREAARLMARNGGGRIVNFGSVAVPLAPKGAGIYAASKAAVLTLTRVFAHELAPFGITVNAISPNPVDTDLLEVIPEPGVDEILGRQAIRRRGTPAEIAGIVDFYLDPQAGHVTGQNLFLGGLA